MIEAQVSARANAILYRIHCRSGRRLIINGARRVALILLNKPFRVLSQFSADGDRRTLSDFLDIPRVYPAGRLDFDSEGLLLLTDNGRLQAQIASPRYKTHKHYWAQGEGSAKLDVPATLLRGVTLKDGPARALAAQCISPPDEVWDRDPPVRFRKTVPDHWLSITIGAGRNRQVRRMTAAAGAPPLRLNRSQVGPWTVNDNAPGEYRQLDDNEAFAALRESRRS